MRATFRRPHRVIDVPVDTSCNHRRVRQKAKNLRVAVRHFGGVRLRRAALALLDFDAFLQHVIKRQGAVEEFELGTFGRASAKRRLRECLCCLTKRRPCGAVAISGQRAIKPLCQMMMIYWACVLGQETSGVGRHTQW